MKQQLCSRLLFLFLLPFLHAALHADGIMLLDSRDRFSSAWRKMQEIPPENLSEDELFLMASYCKEGRKDVPVNPARARRIFRMLKERVASSGKTDGRHLFLLGVSIQNAACGACDNARAYQYISKAAEAGYPPAMTMAAFMLVKGIGTRADPDAALKQLEKAAARNDLTAKAYLASYCLGTGQDLPRGIMLAKESSGAGNRAGRYTLAMAYEKGVGVKKNYAQALRLYQAAADQGLEDARDRLKWLKQALNIPEKQYIDDLFITTLSHADN